MKRKSAFFLIVFTLVFFFQFKSYSQLNGTYTIGLGGNYPTINSAVNDLMTNGVSGPVTFNIKSGTYDEQVFIDSIPGASMTRNIVFQSEALIPDSVIWKSTIPNRNYMICIRNVDFLTIRKLTILDYDHFPYPGKTTLVLSGNLKNVSILDNIFLYDKSLLFPVIGDSALSTYNFVIEGNTFRGFLEYQLNSALIFGTNSGFFRISANIFSGRGNFMFISGVDSILIEKNLFATPDGAIDAGIAIKIAACDGFIRVSKNRFQVLEVFPPSGRDAAIIFENCSPRNALVSNNFIYASLAKGIGSYNSQYIKYYYNTIVGTALANNLEFIGSSPIYMKNNIIVNLSGGFRTGYPMEVESSTLISDYNNFYYHKPFFGIMNGSPLDSLNKWISITGNDHNSKEVPVTFQSSTDFHLAGQSISDTMLIGTPLSEVTDDIDDDSRSPFFPYMGADESNILLPVFLTSLTYSVNRRDITLNWSTLNEINNAGFDIERSNATTGNTYEMIGSIAGSGTIQFPKTYTFIDYGLSTGYYKYRLKQIDFNGNFEYYYLNSEVYVGIVLKNELLQNYPNPFNPKTKIDYELSKNANVSIQIFDVTGKEIMTLVDKKFQNAGYYTIELNGDNLSSGIYFYKLTAGAFSSIKRMLLIK